MISHDYRCGKCQTAFEVAFMSSLDFRREVSCPCGGMASQIWTRAPGLAGVSEPGTRGIARSFEPGYDIQSGRTFNDRAERDKWIKETGRVLMGPEEHKRSMLAQKSEPEPDFSGLKDAMEKSLHEVKQGFRAKPATLDPNIPIVEAK